MSSESPNPVSPDTDDTGEAVLTSFDDGVGRLTLNNPRRKNAITLEMAAAIEEFCDRVTADGNIGAVVVDAAGSYFCSGADTRILAGASADPAAPESVAQLSAVYRAFVRVGSLPVPTVGASTSHSPSICSSPHQTPFSTADSSLAASTPGVGTSPC